MKIYAGTHINQPDKIQVVQANMRARTRCWAPRLCHSGRGMAYQSAARHPPWLTCAPQATTTWGYWALPQRLLLLLRKTRALHCNGCAKGKQGPVSGPPTLRARCTKHSIANFSFSSNLEEPLRLLPFQRDAHIASIELVAAMRC